MALFSRLVQVRFLNKYFCRRLMSGGIVIGGDFLIITLGTTTSDKRALHKNFSGTDITVQLKQPCDILNPVFVVSYDAGLVGANYCYCPELRRYYFVTNIVLSTGHKMEISCAVDVLMSYRDEISAIRCVVTRQQNSGLTLVPDSNIVIQNYNPIDIYNFPTGFDVGFGSYVLQLIGGA